MDLDSHLADTRLKQKYVATMFDISPQFPILSKPKLAELAKARKALDNS